MSNRKPVTERMKVDYFLRVLLKCRQPGEEFFCPICFLDILPGDRIDWDHIQPISRGGEHSYLNIRPLHHECHKVKTFHPRSKATTLGGDNFEAKKAGRIARGGKKRKWPKMRSKPFSASHRPMRRSEPPKAKDINDG